MLEIITAPICTEEKEYIFSVLLKDFLGVDYHISYNSSVKDYKIVYQNQALTIEDHFFCHFEHSSYLKKEHIPAITKTVELAGLQVEKLYGEASYIKKEEGALLSLDLFASAFFMLSRWEEYVDKTRDNHGRFPATASLAYRNNFLTRPVVNEYVNLLTKLLIQLGVPENTFNTRSYELHLSHDVDHPEFFGGFTGFVKKTAYYLLKKKDLKQAFRNIKHYLLRSKDPFDTFDYLMDIAEKNGTKSRFYFMNSQKTKMDSGYEYSTTFVQNVLSRIKTRGHVIGIHPSYQTFENPSLLKSEKEGLEYNTQTTITEGRQHYLRFSTPFTWNHWQEAGLTEDCTLGYGDHYGFRAGVCYPYHPFDFIHKTKMELLETPLVVMDATLVNYLRLTVPEAIEVIKSMKTIIQSYNGTFGVLWHNSSFFTSDYLNYEACLEQLDK